MWDRRHHTASPRQRGSALAGRPDHEGRWRWRSRSLDRSAADLDTMAADIETTGRRGVAHPADVTEPGALAGLAEAAVAELGGLDLWVNNAGGLPDATARYLTRTPVERWDVRSISI